MIKTFFLILAILFIPSLASAQCNGVFPSSTLCGTASVAGVPGPVPLGTFLSSANPNAPTINLFGTSSTTTCCAGLFNVIASQATFPAGGNAIVGSAIQDTNSMISFPTGVTGYGRIAASGVGNEVFGIFGDAQLDFAGVATNEINCANNSADSPNTFPPNLSFPAASSWCIGLQVVATGTKRGHSAFRAASSSGGWLASYYADPASSTLYGIFIDADSGSGGPNTNLLRNNGAGINLTLQTMGTFTPTNPVFESLDASNNVIWRMNQNGGVVVSAATVGAIGYAITNNDTNAGSSAVFQAVTNAGTLLLQMGTTAGSGVSVFRSSGAGTMFIDAFNATGNISVRTGAGPTAALNISAAGLIQVPLITTGTPVAAACFDASNNLIKKVGTSC